MLCKRVKEFLELDEPFSSLIQTLQVKKLRLKEDQQFAHCHTMAVMANIIRDHWAQLIALFTVPSR